MFFNRLLHCKARAKYEEASLCTHSSQISGISFSLIGTVCFLKNRHIETESASIFRIWNVYLDFVPQLEAKYTLKSIALIDFISL